MENPLPLLTLPDRKSRECFKLPLLRGTSERHIMFVWMHRVGVLANQNQKEVFLSDSM